ncbi:MAG: hypothetical protein MUC60_17825 [Oscillatoria sp. Prado101]|nr:hypothetical protein [Oscillatoria sp. Prado101]
MEKSASPQNAPQVKNQGEQRHRQPQEVRHSPVLSEDKSHDFIMRKILC